jgi:uncharacterized RDD family membrane protein YckC
MELFVKRGFAFIIDYLIIMLPTTIVVIVFGVIKLLLSIIPILNRLSDLIWLSSIGFLFYLLYEVIALTLFQTTIGKALMGLRIRQNDQQPLELWTILLRSFLKVLFVTGYFFWMIIINMLIALGHNQHKSLHDLIAGTSVWET